MAAAIEIANLTKRYGRLAAVDRLDLEVPAGSLFGFLGANGAGKTTTIRTIAGLIRPTEGSVALNGVRPDAGSLYRRQFGYLCQEPAFYPWMSGREVLRYAANLHSLDEPTERRVDELLELVGLRESENRPSGEYSGGMRQRLGIAAALIGRPPVVVLDEPASGLDPVGRRDVLELLESLRGRTTVFYSTHILDDVERVSDSVAVLDHGRLVVTSGTRELLSSFSRDRLRVELAGSDGDLTGELASLPGVATVELECPAPGGPAQSFVLEAAPGALVSVQAAVTGFAAERGLVVVEARPIVLDLEDVFLRLIGKQETAA